MRERRGLLPGCRIHTPDGRAMRFESEFGTMPASHQVGQTVKIRFDPGDPQKLRWIQRRRGGWFLDA